MRLTLKEQSEYGMFCPGWQKWHGMLCPGDKNSMGCYVRGDKNSMGYYVRGDKNSMGCFFQGGKSLWDVLSRVSKNGMVCFVPGCFVRLPLVRAYCDPRGGFFYPTFIIMMNSYSLGKPHDGKRRSSSWIFLSYPHTQDRFL